jgi:CheY-like chemotaxis protein
MALRDLDQARAVHAALVALFIQEHGGRSNPKAVARVEALCDAGASAIDDLRGRVAIRGIRSLANLLYSDGGVDDIEIGGLRGVPAIRLQIANGLSDFRGRIQMLEARKPSRPEVPAIEPKRLRVLVVEDHRDSAESLRRLLALCGYEVTIAETAMEGLEAAKREQPDVILCDIGLPDADGFCLAEALQKNPTTSAARLIAVTGYSKDEDKERSKNSGFALHLVKPVSPGTILQVLEDTAKQGARGSA